MGEIHALGIPERVRLAAEIIEKIADQILTRLIVAAGLVVAGAAIAGHAFQAGQTHRARGARQKLFRVTPQSNL